MGEKIVDDNSEITIFVRIQCLKSNES